MLAFVLVCLVLFLFPIAYTMLRRSPSGYDMGMDVMIITLGCWSAVIGLLIGRCIF